MEFNFLLKKSSFDKSALQPFLLDDIVLIASHNFGGGSNFYCDQFIDEKLQNEKTVLLILPEKNCFLVQFLKKDKEPLKFFVDALDAVKIIIKNLFISEVFYNNAVNFSQPLLFVEFMLDVLSIISRAAKFKVAIHDFFPVCPSYALMNSDNKFCGVPVDLDVCRKCLLNNKNNLYFSQNIDISLWREKWKFFLEKSDEIICFSHSSKKFLLKAYPNAIFQKLVVSPHRLDYLKNQKINKNRILDEVLHIGIVGNVDIPHKGAEIIRDLGSLIQSSFSKIKITIIGNYSNENNYSFVKVTGEYKQDQLCDFVNKSGINLFFMPSTCSETFSYVTHELIHFGVPLVSFNLGAQGEAVADYKNGRIINEITAKAALNTMIAFYQELTCCI